MSNEYKDWLWDSATDSILDSGKLDFIYNTLPTPAGFYIEGFKREEFKTYNAIYNNDGQWHFEETKTGVDVNDYYVNGYRRGWQKGYKAAKDEATAVVRQLQTLNEYLRGEAEQLRQELIIARRNY